VLLVACGSGDAPAPAPAAPVCVRSPVPSSFPTTPCTAPRPARPDALDEALAQIGLDRCTIGIPKDRLTRGLMRPEDPHASPDFVALVENPLRLPGHGAETAAWLDDAVLGATPVASALAAAAARRGAPVAGCPDGAWFALPTAYGTPSADPLADAIGKLDPERATEATRTLLAGVPIELQRALVPVVRALKQTHDDVLAARAATPAQLEQIRAAPAWVLMSFRYQMRSELRDAFDAIDVAAMTSSAVRLAAVVEHAKLDRFAGVDVPAVDLHTSFGAIVLRGPRSDVYEAGTEADGAALVLDTGGDDVHRAGAGAASIDHPVALAVDLGGRDRYGYAEQPVPADSVGTRLPSDAAGRRQAGRTASRTPRQGAALLGVGLLLDLGADDDSYRSLVVSQGAGVFGVGALFDAGGNDSYAAEALAQGAAAYGVGLLLDRAGDDRYAIYSQGQGFGFTRGVGALADGAGDDSYFANPGAGSGADGDVLYENTQLQKQANNSFVQGAGFGFRRDLPHRGFQFPGGLGILRDSAGRDSYVASTFAQGSGFAMGTGMLLDGSGDDSYDGLRNVQGASAHTSIGYFHDAAGNDRYDTRLPVVAMSLGVGHDYSIGFHFDQGGDDEYVGPSVSLGSGNTNGVGILVDAGGTDLFRAGDRLSLGSASNTDMLDDAIRRTHPVIGVFVKAGGDAAYVLAGKRESRAGSSWSHAPNAARGAAELSVGVDRPAGSAALP
jgi:hypothetical protein